MVFRPADLILDDDLQYVTTPPKLFLKDVSLGSSAIVEVSEQVEAAQIRIPKKVPGSSPEYVPRQGSQKQVPQNSKNGFPGKVPKN